jgi:hypothetical protein
VATVTDERWPRVRCCFTPLKNGRDAFLTALRLVTTRRCCAGRYIGTDDQHGQPAKVSGTQCAKRNPSRRFDMSTDGQRFLVLRASATGDPNATPASMVVVEHWVEELKSRER